MLHEMLRLQNSCLLLLLVLLLLLLLLLLASTIPAEHDGAPRLGGTRCSPTPRSARLSGWAPGSVGLGSGSPPPLAAALAPRLGGARFLSAPRTPPLPGGGGGGSLCRGMTHLAQSASDLEFSTRTVPENVIREDRGRRARAVHACVESPDLVPGRPEAAQSQGWGCDGCGVTSHRPCPHSACPIDTFSCWYV